MAYTELDIIHHPEHYLPNIQVDNVIFGYHDKELRVLLQQTVATKKWSITGGYVGRAESTDKAANRIASSRTGLENLFLQQFRSFGGVSRSEDPEKNAANMSELTGVEVKKDLWIFDRFVSLAYYTLTDFSTVKIKKWSLDADCRWWPLNDLPALMFDHKEIIGQALKSLRMHISFYPIGYELLSDKFTLPEIHALYETILGRTFDERNFQRKLLSSGIVTKLTETKRIGPHRAPFLYQFNKVQYDRALENGLVLIF